MNNLPLDRSVRLRAMWCHLSGMFWIILNLFTLLLVSIDPVLSGESSWIFRNIVSAIIFTIYVFFALPFVIPLGFWLFNRRMHPFVDRAGKATINYTIGILLQSVVLFLLTVFISVVTCGVSNNLNSVGSTFLTVGAIGIITIVIANIANTTYAAIRASKGETYRYPLSTNIFKYNN